MKIVISASRRTDIPAFYMPWFMEKIHLGAFDVVNPFNRNVSRVSASPEDVHSFVFWSKNYAPFLKGNFGNELTRRGYHLFFQFTVNSESGVLEPGVPPLSQRLDQLVRLCRTFGPESVNWRFDPICFYEDAQGKTHDNLADIDRIARVASGLGIRKCTSSFLDMYGKIRKRIPAPGIRSLIRISPADRCRTARNLQKRLAVFGIALELCCEKEVLAMLPPETGIGAAACIPSRHLMEIFGGAVSCRKDTGQRRRQGCGCGVSVDVGDYLGQPCFHNCLFCYANPAQWSRKAGTGKTGKEISPGHENRISGV